MGQVKGDLISRSALIAELSKGTIILDDYYLVGIMAGVKYAMGKAENAPSVDAVEVVRCKDCKHCTEIGLPRCRRTRRNILDDDFCSYGERRDEE